MLPLKFMQTYISKNNGNIKNHSFDSFITHFLSTIDLIAHSLELNPKQTARSITFVYYNRITSLHNQRSKRKATIMATHDNEAKR